MGARDEEGEREGDRRLFAEEGRADGCGARDREAVGRGSRASPREQPEEREERGEDVGPPRDVGDGLRLHRVRGEDERRSRAPLRHRARARRRGRREPGDGHVAGDVRQVVPGRRGAPERVIEREAQHDQRAVEVPRPLGEDGAQVVRYGRGQAVVPDEVVPEGVRVERADEGDEGSEPEPPSPSSAGAGTDAGHAADQG